MDACDLKFTEISYPPLLSHISEILLSCQDTTIEGEREEIVSSDPIFHMNQLMESLKALSKAISSLPESERSLPELQRELKSKEQMLISFM